jgi:cell wall-associated NlpC family hydrolase
MRARPIVLAALTTLSLVLGVAAPARADSIGDKQREAAAIAARINALEDRTAQLGEDYNQALVESSQLDQEVRDAEARLSAKDAALSGLRKQMAAFALSRYTSNTDPNSFSTLAAGPSLADGAVQRAGYAELALGTNRDVSDELSAARQDTESQRNTLAAKRDRQAQLAQIAIQKKQEAEDAASQLDATLQSVRSDIADLVQQEQARQAAEAARQQREKEAAEEKKAADKAAEQKAAAAAAVIKDATPVKSGVGQGVPATSPPTAPTTGSTGSAGSSGSGGSSGSTGATAAPRAQPTPEVPATSAGAGVAVHAALGQLGVPYAFGQSAPGVGFDCSGLSMYAWGQAGVSLPHSSRAQYDMLPHVPLSDLEPGDLIFSHTPVGHVGIYIGNGQMVHAPQPHEFVMVSPVSPNAIGAGRPG